MSMTRKCTVEGCGAPHAAKGLCITHRRWQRQGKPLVPIKRRQKRDGVCPGPECDLPIRAGGYCGGHYWQVQNGKTLSPISSREKVPRGTPCWVGGDCGKPSLTMDGVCRIHYERRKDGDPDWQRPVKTHRPHGDGHVNEDGYRVISVNGKPRLEHRHIAEQLLGRRLPKHEEVHHRNTNRLDNRTDGPFRLNHRGNLVSGNLEIWLVGRQPRGGEIGPQMEYGFELFEQYGEFLPEAQVDRLQAVVDRARLRARGYRPVSEVLDEARALLETYGEFLTDEHRERLAKITVTS